MSSGLRRTALVAGLAFGLLSLGLALQQLDVRPSEALRAAAVAMVFALPGGALVTRGLGRSVWTLPSERLGLAALVGTPLVAATAYLLALLRLPQLLPALAVLVALAWLLTCRRGSALDWGDPANGVLAAIAGFVLLVTTRGWRAFQPLDGGGLLYDHTLEHAIHLAFSWELLRGVPPAQLPTAVGLPFPHYHVLGYLPLTLLARYGGVGLITAYHGLLPLWNLALLCAGIHLVVRARVGRLATSVAALVGLFFVVGVLESRFVPETFAGRAPLEFFLRTVSGSSGTLVWVAVACLLAVADDGRSRALGLGALLAGLSYGFKAQMFLLLGVAFVAALGLLWLRGQRRSALVGLACWAAGFLPLMLTWRVSSRLGALAVEWGRFARETGFAAPFEPWGGIAVVVLGTPLALVALLRGSPLWPAFAVTVLRRWRSASALDLFLGLLPVAALLLASGLVAEEAQPGEITALILREALFGMQIAAVVMDVALLAWLAGRWMRDGPRTVLGLVLVAALALAPLTARVTTHRGPRRPIELSADEVGALQYLRTQTPLDAVVAQARAWSKPELATEQHGLDMLPLVAGLAGRRTVLEYYRPDIDPEVHRGRALRRLLTTTDVVEGEGILDRFDVDYVLEYATRPLLFRSPRLTVAYERGEVRVWRVARNASGPRPGPLYAPAELR